MLYMNFVEKVVGMIVYSVIFYNKAVTSTMKKLVE